MINIGISKKNYQEVTNRLNHLLADEYILYTKTWKFHWNIEGKHFGALHLFLDTQRKELEEIIDNVAERIRTFNIKSDGTLKEFIKNGCLTEQPGKNPDDLSMIKILLKDHEEIIKNMTADIAFTGKINDYGTNNFLCTLIEQHEHMAWLLRAHTQ
jgi:starvation-inducible DNA-binding protein